MAAGLPVDKWFAFGLLVLNSTVLPPAMLGTRPDPSEKRFYSDKVSDFSSKERRLSEGSDSFGKMSDRWADEMRAVAVRARSA